MTRGSRSASPKFRDNDRALKAYCEREEQYRDNPRVEVVLLGADSIEAIKVTHSNWLRGQSQRYREPASPALGPELIPAPRP